MIKSHLSLFSGYCAPLGGPAADEVKTMTVNCDKKMEHEI